MGGGGGGRGGGGCAYAGPYIPGVLLGVQEIYTLAQGGLSLPGGELLVSCFCVVPSPWIRIMAADYKARPRIRGDELVLEEPNLALTSFYK